MCRPNPTDCVRPRIDCQLTALEGSIGVRPGKKVTVSKETVGMAEGPVMGDPDSFIILFGCGDTDTVRAVLPHSMLKGVEAGAHF